MGDVPKNQKHSGDGSPLVHLGSRGCRPRQKHLRGLEQIHTDLGEHHLHVQYTSDGSVDLAAPTDPYQQPQVMAEAIRIR